MSTLNESESFFMPVWHGVFEGYATNFVAKNAWRVPRYMNHEDCMQEAHIVFLRCKARYQVKDAPHFMALFKTMLFQEFTDLSVKGTKHRAEVSLTVEDDDAPARQHDCIGDTDNSGALRVALQQMPREVACVVSLFLNAPQELVDLAMAAWSSRVRGGKNRAGSNAHLNKLLGLPADADPIRAVQDYFRP